MRELTQTKARRHRLLPCVMLFLAFSSYIDQVLSLPVDSSVQWPTFPRRNIAALAREGYLRSISPSFKRSISTLAKNGQLPTYRSPYGEADKPDQDEEESQEKRNIASIARLRSYTVKRNIQSLARDGYHIGRAKYQSNEKRVAPSMPQILIRKRDEVIGSAHYYPFNLNPVPPFPELIDPLDLSVLYNVPPSINPDVLPPLPQIFKGVVPIMYPIVTPENSYETPNVDRNLYFKRGTVGMPAHGLYRPIYIDTPTRTKRYILSLPDDIDNNDMEVPETNDNDNDNEDKRSVDEELRDKFAKRHIGSLARLGLLPSFRFSGGRYSRSGRARLLLPSQELYRKHSFDENFGVREYSSNPEAEPAIDSDDSYLPPPPILAHSHPTGRYLRRSLNDLNVSPSSLPQNPSNSAEIVYKNSWQAAKHFPRFHYFRSMKPYQLSGKRYSLESAGDDLLPSKTYRNNSLPSRRKNQ